VNCQDFRLEERDDSFNNGETKVQLAMRQIRICMRDMVFRNYFNLGTEGTPDLKYSTSLQNKLTTARILACRQRVTSLLPIGLWLFVEGAKLNEKEASGAFTRPKERV
jgi:hypothetical protein